MPPLLSGAAAFRVLVLLSLEGDGAGEMLEVVHHVAVAEVDFDDHVFDAALFVAWRLHHGFHQASNGDVVWAAWAFNVEGVFHVDAFFVDEGKEPVLEVHFACILC